MRIWRFIGNVFYFRNSHERLVRSRLLLQGKRTLEDVVVPRAFGGNGSVGDRRVGGTRGEDALQRMQHELVDRARIAEAHLDLRRMDVDVHAARVDLEEE